MKIAYRPTDFQLMADCELYAAWENDPAIRHLAMPHKDAASIAVRQTPQAIHERRHNPHTSEEMIVVDGALVGHCSIQVDPPHRVGREGKTAWLAIVIGNADYRGNGIGKLVLEHLEKEGRKLGCDRAEAGVFEFNEPSLKLFRKAGYQEIGQLKDFTYWNGRLWKDIRFAKRL